MKNIERVLNLKDDATLTDLLNGNEAEGKHNFIVVRDPVTNAILQTRKNLVVRKGRELSLRKLFNLPYDGETQANLNARSINAFGIGSGGVPASDPFNPLSPTPADAALNKEIFFRSLTSSQSLTSADAARYTDMRTVNGNKQYFKKGFSNRELIMDNSRDDYYVKLTLEINEADARGSLVSELGLFSSSVDTNNAQTNFILATRVTFQSEPLAVETNKGLLIEYYVYA